MGTCASLLINPASKHLWAYSPSSVQLPETHFPVRRVAHIDPRVLPVIERGSTLHTSQTFRNRGRLRGRLLALWTLSALGSRRSIAVALVPLQPCEV